MAKLINGNGNPAIYAAEDADLIASLAGNVTCIANVGNKYAATEEDATTIRLDDGVIITKEGRRIQLEAGESDTFYIPTGTSGVTNYYIIGYKLVQNADSTQVAEQFVQKMNSSTATITEDTFRSGATEVYVSLYRVTQVGFTISSITELLPELLNSSEVEVILNSKASYLKIYLPGADSSLASDLEAAWGSLPTGVHFVRVANSTEIYSGSMVKYSNSVGTIFLVGLSEKTLLYVKGSGIFDVLNTDKSYPTLNTTSKKIIEAINELEFEMSNITHGNISAASGLSIVYPYIHACNHICQIPRCQIYTSSNDISNGMVIGQLPAGFYPAATTVLEVQISSRYGNRSCGLLTLQTDGKISIAWQNSNITAVGEVSLNGCYII